MDLDDFIEIVNEELIARSGESIYDLDVDVDFEEYFNEDMAKFEINQAIKNCVQDILGQMEDEGDADFWFSPFQIVLDKFPARGRVGLWNSLNPN